MTINSGIAFSTVSELSINNNTGKPNFDTNQGAEQLSRDNRKWDGGELGTAGDVTFSFLSNAQAQDTYRQLTAAQMVSAEKAMDILSSVANITFNEADGGAGANISNQGEIKFQGYDGGGGGWASWSMRGGGDTLEITNSTIALGGSSLSLALHEICHAIALSHPGDYNGGGFNYEDNAEFYQDSKQYSVMSYWGGSKTGAVLGRYTTDEGGNSVYMGGATGLGLYDIAALQRVYGSNDTTYATDTVYGFNSNTGDDGWTLDGKADWIQAAIWDAGGNDTIDMSGYSEDAEIDLREEAFSSTGGLKYNLAIAKGVVVENATGGSGDDVLNGNGVGNILQGNAGADTISGGNGTDWLYGGNDIDTLNGGSGNDLIFGGQGADIINGGADNDYIWGGADGDTIHGNGGVDWLRGEAGLDMLYGDAGNDVLLGGGGNDQMWGGSGTDTFYGGADNDTINGGANGDVAFGQNGNDIMNGGSEGDFLFGGIGMDTINGGTQNDLLWGNLPGAGDGVRDIFDFSTGWGFDAVYDFELGIDQINMGGIGGLTQYSDLTIYDGGANVTIAFGVDAITLYGVTLSELNANQGDFDFI